LSYFYDNQNEQWALHFQNEISTHDSKTVFPQTAESVTSETIDFIDNKGNASTKNVVMLLKKLIDGEDWQLFKVITPEGKEKEKQFLTTENFQKIIENLENQDSWRKVLKRTQYFNNNFSIIFSNIFKKWN